MRMDSSSGPSSRRWLLRWTVHWFRDAGSGLRISERPHSHVRRPSRIKAGRVDFAAGVLRIVGCPAKPVDVTGGQVAQLRDAVDLDALGNDALQCVSDADLRSLDLPQGVVAVAQREDGFRGGGLDPFVAGGPIMIQSDPPLTCLSSRLLLRPRDPPHPQFPSVLAGH